jgi:hypothetical protein
MEIGFAIKTSTPMICLHRYRYNQSVLIATVDPFAGELAWLEDRLPGKEIVQSYVIESSTCEAGAWRVALRCVSSGRIFPRISDRALNIFRHPRIKY